MTLYGYARVSVREPEDKNLDLQVERLVRAGCSLGNIRAEEASGARNDRGGLLELLTLVVEGDTLVVTHIDRLSRGLTHGLQVIEGLHRAGVEFRSLSEDFDTATATGKLQLAMVLAFSEWWRNSIRERSVAGTGEGAGRGPFPWPAAQLDRAATGVHPGGAVEGSEPAGPSQAPGGQPLDHPTGGQVGVGWKMRPLHGAWPIDSLTQYQRGQRRGKVLQAVDASPRGLSNGLGQRTNQAEAGASQGRQDTERRATGPDPGAGEAVPGWPRRDLVCATSPG